MRQTNYQKKLVRPQPIMQNKCPECESVNFIHDYKTGETICGVCGLVIGEEMLDTRPEWRAFTQIEDTSRSRVGPPTAYSVHDKRLSTVISWINRDASGRKLPLSTRLQMWRLRKWQIRSVVQSSIDRNLAQAMTELDRLSDKVYIPSPIKERAAVIYRKALDKGLVRGRPITAITTASLYAACRSSGTPRTLREIAEASLVDKKDVARYYRLLLRELDLQMPIPDPLTYVSKIAEGTGISAKTQGLAIHFIRAAKKRRSVAGKSPVGLASAALYLACLEYHEKKTQKDIAIAAGVTEVTLRNRYKILKQQLSLNFPHDFSNSQSRLETNLEQPQS